MLAGLELPICVLLIAFPSVVFVGAVTALGWARNKTKTPPSLVALAVALLPDLVMVVDLFTGFRIVPVVANSDNATLFAQWQIVSAILIAVALWLALFEREGVNKTSLRGSLILLSIHGAGTLLFFSDSVLSWFRELAS
jgi:hypothetical protein